MAAPVQSVYDLENRGFDVDAGIAMCAGDEDIYLEVLEAALDEGKEKIPFIRECYEKKDFERYCIEVHGLKNAARSIGANHLSDISKVQEFAVKENNLHLVDEGVEALLAEYQDLVDALEELMSNQ